MTLFSVSEGERRLALQLLGWALLGDYAFAWKDDGVLLVSRTECAGGMVYEVDLGRSTTRKVGGSGEFRLPFRDPGEM